MVRQKRKYESVIEENDKLINAQKEKIGKLEETLKQVCEKLEKA